MHFTEANVKNRLQRYIPHIIFTERRSYVMLECTNRNVRKEYHITHAFCKKKRHLEWTALACLICQLRTLPILNAKYNTHPFLHRQRLSCSGNERFNHLLMFGYINLIPINTFSSHAVYISYTHTKKKNN